MIKNNQSIVSKEAINESVDFLKSVTEAALNQFDVEELDKIDELLEQCKDLCLIIKTSK